MYSGDVGVYTYTFELSRKEECSVCGSALWHISLPIHSKLQDLIDILLDKIELQLKKPSLRTESKSLYMQAPKQLELATRANLEVRLKDLVHDDEEINVTDLNLPITLRILLVYKD